MSTRTKRNNARRRALRSTADGAAQAMTNRPRQPTTQAPRASIPTIGDQISMRFRGMTELVARTPGGSGVGDPYGRRLIVLGKGTSSDDYLFLSTLMPGFNALAGVFSRFLITRVRAEVRSTHGAYNGGTVVLNYEATNSGVALAPSGIADVGSATNVATATPGTTGTLTVNPTNYFPDWRTVTDNGQDGQAGVMQWYATNPGGTVAGVTLSVMSIEIDVSFAGHRST